VAQRVILKVGFGLSDFGLSDFGLSDFGLSDFRLSDFGLSDFGLSDFGLSDFGLSDSSTFNFSPKIQLSNNPKKLEKNRVNISKWKFRTRACAKHFRKRKFGTKRGVRNMNGLYYSLPP
jgi:hypothetical protein